MGLFDKFRKKDTALNIEKTNVLDGVAIDKNGTELIIMLLSDGMDRHDEESHILYKKNLITI